MMMNKKKDDMKMSGDHVGLGFSKGGMTKKKAKASGYMGGGMAKKKSGYAKGGMCGASNPASRPIKKG